MGVRTITPARINEVVLSAYVLDSCELVEFVSCSGPRTRPHKIKADREIKLPASEKKIIKK